MRVEICDSILRVYPDDIYLDREYFRHIHGRVWNKELNCYEMAATYESAMYLVDMLPSVTAEPEFYELLHPPLVELEKFEPIDLPSTFPAWEHQRVGYALLLNMMRTFIGWDMGTGKTKLIIDTALELKRRGNIDYCLILCKKNLMDTWVDEIKLHQPNATYTVAYSSKAIERRISIVRDSVTNEYGRRRFNKDFLIVNYDGIKVLKDFIDSYITPNTWVVADEITQLKHLSERTKVISKLLEECRVRRRTAMSGTPVTNSPLDLFAEYLVLDQSVFGPKSHWQQFKAIYAITEGRGGFTTVVGYKNLDVLTRKIRNTMHRVTKEQCLDLPPKVYEKIPLDPSPQFKVVYKNFVDEYVLPLKDVEITLTNSLAVMNKALQLTSGFLYDDNHKAQTVIPVEDDIKLQLLFELLDEGIRSVFTNAGSTLRYTPTIVWTYYNEDTRRVCSALQMKNVPYSLYSGTTEDEAEAKNEFMSGKTDIIVVPIARGAMGLNLQRATRVFYYCQVHSVEQRLQSEDRAHRAGQTSTVVYYDPIYKGTIDVTVYRQRQKKIELAKQIMSFDSLCSVVYGEEVE